MTRYSPKTRSAWKFFRYTVFPFLLLGIVALVWVVIAVAVPFLPAVLVYGILDFIRGFWVSTCETTTAMVRIAKAIYGLSFVSWIFFQSLLTYILYKWWSNR